PGGRSSFFRERGRALRVPKLVERLVHVGRRIQIVLKEELHRAFARFASSSHTNLRCSMRDKGGRKNCDAQPSISKLSVSERGVYAALEFGHFWGGNGAVVPKGLPIIARQFTAGNTRERS